MKKIRIKICNYDPEDKCSYGHFILNILNRHYEIELAENPDYLFFNENDYEHLKYDCIKIFYTGENLSPNLNLCDYAFGFDYMNFSDRYYRLPVYQIANFYRPVEIEKIGSRKFYDQLNFTRDDLAQKTDFCSFVYSNYLSDPSRKEFFDKLNGYKKVNSGGAYLNNVGGRIENKLEFELKHKFSIAFENSSRAGYTTEKLTTALLAKTIPIYWGNPEIGREFNEERFINCHKYANFDEVINRVKEVDQNEELYLKIINEPVPANGYDFEKIVAGFESFLKNIIDQPIKIAKRKTINPMRAIEMEMNEKIIAKHVNKGSGFRKILAKIYRPFKRIGRLENMKQRYLSNKLLKK